MESRTITHIGRVIAIEGGIIKVSIMSDSACAGCHAKGKCGLSESKEKIVEVDATTCPTAVIGNEVEVFISVRGGIVAVVMAYIIPVILVVISLWLGELIGISEPLSFFIMLLTVTLYYIFLYYMRKRFDKKMKIRIKQK